MACPREKREMIERTLVGEFGVRAEDSKGRRAPEPECEIRTCFQRDVDRITHSKSFRRLKHKTQVYLRPEGDHYRTRLTHTLEVSRLARTIARALDLNEDLTEAMALGHDLGHTPFGHAGERAPQQNITKRASSTMSSRCALSISSSATVGGLTCAMKRAWASCITRTARRTIRPRRPSFALPTA